MASGAPPDASTNFKRTKGRTLHQCVQPRDNLLISSSQNNSRTTNTMDEQPRIEPGFSPKPAMLSEEDFLDNSTDTQPSPSGSPSPSCSPGMPTESPTP